MALMGMPQLLTATYSTDSNVAEGWTSDQEAHTPQWLYQRLDITYTQAMKHGDSRLAHASIAWDHAQELQHAPDILLHILPIGEKTPDGNLYPGDYPDKLDEQHSNCAVLNLKRWESASAALPSVAVGSYFKFDADKAMFESYVACNETFTGLVERDSLTAQSPCWHPVQMLVHGHVPEIPTSLCVHECLSDFRGGLASALDVCKQAWTRFRGTSGEKRDKLGSDDASDYSERLHSVFVARLGLMARIKQALDLSCTFNFYNHSCLAVEKEMERKAADNACEWYGYRFWDADFSSITHMMPEYQVADGQQICRSSGCKETLMDIIKSGHCCVSTWLKTKRDLLEVFISPGETAITVNVAEYNCRIHSRCDRAQELVEISSYAASECNEEGAAHLQCLSGRCGLPLVWPRACCLPTYSCIHGERSYMGACFCMCAEPYTGADCSKALPHVKIDLSTDVEDLMYVDHALLEQALARALRVEPALVEPAFISQQLVPAQRRQQKRLVFGFRVLSQTRPLLAFSQEIKFYLESGRLDEAAADMGLSLSFSLSRPPRAISSTGFVCDPALQNCPQETLVVQNEPKQIEQDSIWAPFLLVAAAAVLGICACAGVAVSCYRARFRLALGLQSHLKTTPAAQAARATGNHEAGNPMDRPNNLRFESVSEQRKRRYQEQDADGNASVASAHRSATASIKIETASSIRGGMSDRGDASSVRSALTSKSFFSRGSKTAERLAKAAASRQSVSFSFSSQPEIPSSDDGERLAAGLTEPAPAATQGWQERGTRPRTFHEKQVTRAVEAQGRVWLQQRGLMASAGLPPTTAPAFLSPRLPSSLSLSPSLAGGPQENRATAQDEAALSVDLHLVGDTASVTLDPWRKQGKPQQLWFSTPPTLLPLLACAQYPMQ